MQLLENAWECLSSSSRKQELGESHYLKKELQLKPGVGGEGALYNAGSIQTCSYSICFWTQVRAAPSAEQHVPL